MGCANPLCRCPDGTEAGFCSPRCRQHGTEQAEGESCDCGHRECTGEDAPLNDL